MKTTLFQITSGASRALGLLCAILIAGASAARAVSPAAVSNVRAAQRPGAKLVDIQYDLTYSGTSPFNISVLVSANSGTTWDVPALTFGGDYGSGVSPGANRHVVWDAGADWDGQYTTNCRVRVLASLSGWIGCSAPSSNWVSVACSADGTKLVAAEHGGGVYTSPDSGATWIPRMVGSQPPRSVACSADGTVVVLAVPSLQIATSTDSGVTWRWTAPNSYWTAVACSADGTRVVAVQPYAIYISTDSGLNWNLRTNGLPAGLWFNAVASSADGRTLLAVAAQGAVCISTNSGDSWTYQTHLDFHPNWVAAASSADGTRLHVVGEAGAQADSKNSGATWVSGISQPAAWWSGLACSADGTKCVAVTTGGIYTSMDSGSSWNKQSGLPANASWMAVACSADGTAIFAVAFNGYIFKLTW